MLVLLRRNKLVLLYAAFIIAYLIVTFTTPPDPEALAKYNLTASQAQLLSITIVVPVILIWLTGLVGYLRMRSYVDLIKKSKDGAAFRTLSYGILWLGLWLPLSSLLSSLSTRYYTANPEATATLVRLDNYFNIIILFPAFLLVYLGSKKLMPVIKKPTFAPSMTVVLGFIVFTALYVGLTLHDPARSAPVTSDGMASYYLSDWAILTTIVIPRLVMWFLGIQAVYNLYLYSRYVKGSLYRKALVGLAVGIGAVVGTTILLRSLQSVSSSLVDASLGAILIFIYVLLLIISIGYVFIARGAQDLRKLEDI